MIFEHRQSRVDRALSEALTLLDHWYVAASATGRLWIQPKQRSFKLDEFAVLVKRLARLCEMSGLNQVYLDFREAEILPRESIVVVSLIEAFAKRMNATCRIITEDDGSDEPSHAKAIGRAERFCFVLESRSAMR